MDRSTKQRLYSTARVGQYWFVILAKSQLEVDEQHDAESGKYAQRTIFASQQVVLRRLTATRSLASNVSELFR